MDRPDDAALLAELDAAYAEMGAAVERQWNGKHALNLSIPARPQHDTDLIVCNALRKASVALRAALQREQEMAKLKTLAEKVDAIRDSIIGTQTVNWSAHVYPLVAALGEAGFEGEGYELARKKASTLIEQRDAAYARAEAAERELATASEARPTPAPAPSDNTAQICIEVENMNSDQPFTAPAPEGRTLKDADVVEKLQWLRKFVEYARYELQPGVQQFGDQFPRQDAADRALAEIDTLLVVSHG